MEPVENADATPTEAPQPPQAAQKKPRSEAQLKALEAARAKALATRKENAELRQKEKAVKSHHKQERVRQVEEAYQKIPKAQEEEDDWDAPIEELPAPYREPKAKKRKKPVRRVIIQEASSSSEEDDVEVILPKLGKTPPPEPNPDEVNYRRAMNRMFNLAI